MRAHVRQACLVVSLMLVASPVVAMDQPPLEERLRRVMLDCGRQGYVLKPVGDRRLIVSALPYIRQTPLSEADMRCIRRGVHKIGWKLAADELR